MAKLTSLKKWLLIGILIILLYNLINFSGNQTTFEDDLLEPNSTESYHDSEKERIRAKNKEQRLMKNVSDYLRNLEAKVDTWQNIGDKKLRFKVFSAYFDDRRDAFGRSDRIEEEEIKFVIHVNTILPLDVFPSAIFCHFRYNDGRIETTPPSDVIPHVHRDGTTFIATFLACPVVDDADYPEAVGITHPTKDGLNNFVKIRYPQNMTNFKNPVDKFAICPTPLHFHFRWSLKIVEFIEIYKMLGVSKFYIYDDLSTPAVKKVLNYYKEQGVVEVFDWNMREYFYDKDLRLAGLLNTFTDCVYRARVVDNFKYMIDVDYDEILLFFNGTKTLQEFVRKYDTGSTHSFKIQTALFFSRFKHDYSTVPNNTVNRELVTQVFVERLGFLLAPNDRTKYIANTKNCLIMDNHYVLISTNGTREVAVKPEVATVYHFRESCLYGYCGSNDKKIDTSARKYAPPLWERVDSVCKKIFADGKCPN